MCSADVFRSLCNAARAAVLAVCAVTLAVCASVLAGCAAPPAEASQYAPGTPPAVSEPSPAVSYPSPGFSGSPSAATGSALQGSSMDGYNSKYDPAHIDSREAWELFNANHDAVVMDVRSEVSFLDYRVSVAVNVQFEEVADYARENIEDLDRVIICYCFCDDKGGSALSAYKLLSGLGYLRVFYTEPGDEWTYAGASVSAAAADDASGGEPGEAFVTGAAAKDLFDNNSGVILLDVRNPDEYAQNHIEGSMLIPVAELESRLSELPDRDAIIIVFCRSGVRSGNAQKILAANGYSRVYDMRRVTDWPG